MLYWKKGGGNPIRVILEGNKEVAKLYIPEATQFLSILKRSIDVSGLDCLQQAHHLPDGSDVIVNSGFGMDEIIIRSPFKEGISLPASLKEEEEKCKIKLINFPTVIPPSRYPGIIQEGEVLGEDYFVSKYNFDISKCEDCKRVHFDLSFKYSEKLEPRHYCNSITNECDVKNH